MNIYSDIVLFAVSLLVNLLLFGILVAVGIAAAFRLIPNINPRVYYVISVAAFLIAIFVPLTVTFQVIFNTLPVSTAAVSPEKESIGEISTPGTNQSIVTTLQVIEQDVIERTTTPLKTNLLGDFIFFISNSLIGIFSLGLWIIISAYLLFQEITGHRKLQKSRDNWQVADARERKELFCPEDIRLYFADNQSPYTAGFLRPAVVFPKNFSINLSPDSIRFIVYHEIAHVRWLDPLVNAVLRTFRALFWVSPALWFLEYIAKREREAAADYAALSAISNLNNNREAANEYAELLLSIAKIASHNSKQSPASLTAVYFGGASLLENRIQRLLIGYSSPTPIRSFLATAAFSAVFIGMAYIPVVSKPAGAIYPELSVNELGSKTSEDIWDSIKQGFAITDNSKKISSVEKSINSEGESKKALTLSESETDLKTAPTIKEDINSDSETKQDTVKTASSFGNIKEMPDGASTNAIADEIATEVAILIATAIADEIANPAAGDLTSNKYEQESKPVNHDKSPDFIDEMASIGYANLSVSQLVKLKQAGVTTSYVKSLRTVGLGNLSVGEIANLGFAGVTSGFVKKLRSIGYGNLSAGQLAEFGFHGVTPAFINSMRAAGLENLSPQELISLRVSNITPEFAGRARNQSNVITIKQIIDLKRNGSLNKSDE